MSDDGDLSAGTLSFVDRFEAVLQDGEYEVLVGHRVANIAPRPPPDKKTAADPDIFDETFVSRQHVTVKGSRFTLPPDMISARFPPLESTGEYEAVLPHLVFRRATLPWERSPSADGANDGTPWLALLVFHGSDVRTGQPLPWEARTARAGELLASEAGVVSYPDLGFEGDESADDPCLLIDIPAALWQRVAPRADDLRWLAHGRETGTAPVRFSVVVANRLPHADQRCTAHLVSVEGLREMLPGGSRQPTDGVVRLISLASWSFTSHDPKQTFIARVKALAVGPLQLPLAALATSAVSSAATAPAGHLTNDPASDSDAQVDRALSVGYTAKNHHTRAGDRTVSWYRGPLLPYRKSGDAATFTPLIDLGRPVHTADALLRYDATTGIFDVSYAAAWQLGRLLMLQNTSVATALAQWKHDNLLQVAVGYERLVLGSRLDSILDLKAMAESAGGDVETLHRAGASELLGKLEVSGPPAPTTSDAAAPRVQFQHPQAAQHLTEAFNSPAMWRESRSSGPLPETVALWLRRLRLLHGIPATYLIAGIDARGSLPPESLRVFEVDWNWIDALVEGAFSIGRSSPAAAAHDSANHGVFHDPSDDPSDGASDAATPGLQPVPFTLSGCLLHSVVAADWPTLEIRAFDGAGNPLAMARPVERLTPQILFCLFVGELGQIELREPAEGLHFGFEAEDAGPLGRRFKKPLRSLDATTARAARAVPFHDESERVVDIDQLARDIGVALDSKQGYSNAKFALEMVEGVQAVRFAAEEKSR